MGLGLAVFVVIPGLLESSDPAASEMLVAHLQAFDGDVTTRAPRAFNWREASVDQELYDGHRVRTFEASSAQVRFVEIDHSLLVEEDTQVVIRHASTDDTELAELSAPVLDLQIDEPGRLRLRSASGKPVVFRVKKREGDELATLDARRAANSGIDVDVVVQEDGRALIASHRTGGTQPVTVQVRGRTIQLAPGHAALIPAAGDAEVTTRALLDAPRIQSPKNNESIRLTSEKAVNIAWTEVPEAVAYEVVVSRDTTLDAAVQTWPARTTSLRYQPNESGEYHVRVAGVGPENLPGELSPLRSFSVRMPEPPPTQSTPVAVKETATTPPQVHVTAVAERSATPTPKPTKKPTPVATTAAARPTPPKPPTLDPSDPAQRAMAAGHRSLQQGNFGKAVRSYRKAANTHGDAEPHFWLAVAYAYQGEFESACSEFDRYVRMAPKGTYVSYASANLEVCP